MKSCLVAVMAMFLPMVIFGQETRGTLSGAVYSKYGQLIFAANGNYNLKFAVGSALFLNALQCTLAPTQLLPPATDVYLVQ